MKRYLFLLTFITLVLTSFSLVSYCSDMSTFLFEPDIGRGDAWTMGTAFTGVAVDSGFSGGIRNPSLMDVNRNEISGEGDAWNAVVSQSHLDPPSPRVGVGSIGYLVHTNFGMISLGYVAQTRFQSGVKHSTANISRRADFSSYTLGYAKRISDRLSFGMDVGWMKGRAHYGAKVVPADKDTALIPSVFRTRVGLSGKTDAFDWGVVAYMPQFGKYVIERPINVGNKTEEVDIDYFGGLGFTAGIGKTFGEYILETDFTFIETSSVEVDGVKLESSTPLASIGIAGRRNIFDNVEATTGFRIRMSDPNDRTFFLWGLGAKYVLNKDIDLFGSMQLMFPTVSNSDDTLLDDVTPWCLRAGFSFHGE